MLDALHTVIFVVVFFGAFGVILPVVSRFVSISYTWTLVTIYLAILCGVIFDFSHLSHHVRMTLSIGSILVSLAFIYSRASERARSRGEKLPTPEFTFRSKHGEASIGLKARKVNPPSLNPVDDSGVLNPTTAHTPFVVTREGIPDEDPPFNLYAEEAKPERRSHPSLRPVSIPGRRAAPTSGFRSKVSSNRRGVSGAGLRAVNPPPSDLYDSKLQIDHLDSNDLEEIDDIYNF